MTGGNATLQCNLCRHKSVSDIHDLCILAHNARMTKLYLYNIDMCIRKGEFINKVYNIKNIILFLKYMIFITWLI